VSNEIDRLVEEKIEEKLGLYEPKKSGRRTANLLRDRIQEELTKRPKTTHELKNAINSTESTVENHCRHLQDLGVVNRVEVEDQHYWRLNK